MVDIISFRKIPKPKLFILLLLLIALALVALVLLAKPEDIEAPSQKPPNSMLAGHYTVTDVIDGDTIKVDLNGQVKSVRLIGIDAPELPNECFAYEAASIAKKTLGGQAVKLQRDKSQDNKDRYGRLLRYVILEDGTNFNQFLIANGYAKEFTFISAYQLKPAFIKAQSDAKKNKLGLWSVDTCAS